MREDVKAEKEPRNVCVKGRNWFTCFKYEDAENTF